VKKGVSIRSSEIYQISPQVLKALGLELMPRSGKKAYSSPKYSHLSEEQRLGKYEALRESIKNNGFDPKHPIEVMLLRDGGKKDKLFQGHHRLAIAIDLNLLTVPVRFLA
jgi:hypothetical protein